MERELTIERESKLVVDVEMEPEHIEQTLDLKGEPMHVATIDLEMDPEHVEETIDLKKLQERQLNPVVQEQEEQTMEWEPDVSQLVPAEYHMRDVETPPLPPAFMYLQNQLEFCRAYLRKKRPIMVEGPGQVLHLGAPRHDKSLTLVLDLDETLLYGYVTEKGVPINKKKGRPLWEPTATEDVVLSDGARTHKYEV